MLLFFSAIDCGTYSVASGTVNPANGAKSGHLFTVVCNTAGQIPIFGSTVTEKQRMICRCQGQPGQNCNPKWENQPTCGSKYSMESVFQMLGELL